jgi:hypothetical protein
MLKPERSRAGFAFDIASLFSGLMHHKDEQRWGESHDFQDISCGRALECLLQYFAA